MILVEDWKFHICLFLDKNSPRNNKMSDKSSRKKKQVLLDYRNMDFICSSYCIFLKGLTHDLGRKMEFSSLLIFTQNGP